MANPGRIESLTKKWGVSSPESSPHSLMSTMNSKRLLVGGSLTSAAWIIRMLQEKRRREDILRAEYQLSTPLMQPGESASAFTTRLEINRAWLSSLALPTPASSKTSRWGGRGGLS